MEAYKKLKQILLIVLSISTLLEAKFEMPAAKYWISQGCRRTL
jgi:hypothetical protein